MIVDADICIKLGGSNTFHFLFDILPLFADELYIHKIVYSEIRFPPSAKRQVDDLIKEKKMVCIDELSLSTPDRFIYSATFDLLASVMMNPNSPNKNRGEIASLAYAKTTSIPIFATDEKDLQQIIDSRLNTKTDSIRCLRIENLIKSIRQGEIQGISRKQAKIAWVLAGKDKAYFDSLLWPISIFP